MIYTSNLTNNSSNNTKAITVGKTIDCDFVVTTTGGIDNISNRINLALQQAFSEKRDVKVMPDTYTYNASFNPVSGTNLIIDNCTFVNHTNYNSHYFCFNNSNESQRNLRFNFNIKANNTIIDCNNIPKSGAISLRDVSNSSITGLLKLQNIVGSWGITVGTEPSAGSAGAPTSSNVEGSISTYQLTDNYFRDITCENHSGSYEMFLFYNQDNLFLENITCNNKKLLSEMGYTAPSTNPLIDGNRPLIGLWQSINNCRIRKIRFNNCKSGSNGIYYCLSTNGLIIDDVVALNSGNIIFGAIITDNGRAGKLYAENVHISNVTSIDTGANKLNEVGINIGATRYFSLTNINLQNYSNNVKLDNGSVLTPFDSGALAVNFFPRNGIFRDCILDNANEIGSTNYGSKSGLHISIGGYIKTSPIAAQNGNFAGGTIDCNIVFNNCSIKDTRTVKKMYQPVQIESFNTIIKGLEFRNCDIQSFNANYPVINISPTAYSSGTRLDNYTSLLINNNINNHNFYLKNNTINKPNVILIETNDTQYSLNKTEIVIFDEFVQVQANSVIDISVIDEIRNTTGGNRDYTYRLYFNHEATSTSLGLNAISAATDKRIKIEAQLYNQVKASKFNNSGVQQFYGIGYFSIIGDNKVNSVPINMTGSDITNLPNFVKIKLTAQMSTSEANLTRKLRNGIIKTS